jgi:hypothetical protein
MAVQIPFPLPSHGFALNSKMRVNLDFLVDKFNEFNTGAATWDTVAIGIANNETGTLTFYNSSNVNYLTFKPGVTAANTTYTFPATLLGSTGILQSTNAGIMSWTRDPSVDTITATGLGSFGSISNVNSIGIKNISAPTFLATVKANTATATSFDFFLPPTAGTNGQLLSSDGTQSQWTTFAPVTTGVAGYYAIYFGATIGGASTVLNDHFNFNTKSVRLALADHGALAADRTYTIPDVGANCQFLMNAGDIATTGDIGNVGDATKAIRSYNFIVYGYLGSGHATINYPGAASSGNNYTLNLPLAQGAVSTFLQNDGSGNLSWVAAGADTTHATKALDNLASTAVNIGIFPGTDNSIDLGSTSKAWTGIHAVDFYAGRSGVAGDVLVYPTTASKGHIIIEAIDSAGDFITHIRNASMAASQIYTIPDAGAAASFVMTAGTQTIDGSKTFSSDTGISKSIPAFLVTDTGTGAAYASFRTNGLAHRVYVGQNDSTGNGLLGSGLAYSGQLGTLSTDSLELITNATSRLIINGSTGTATFSGQLIGKGTATNDSAAAGYIGESIRSLVTRASGVSATTTGQWFDITSITLTAGDWLVTGMGLLNANGATITANSAAIAISINSANTITDHVEGDNVADILVTPSAATDSNNNIPNYRLSLSGSTIVYLKCLMGYSVATPKGSGRISAVRIR